MLLSVILNQIYKLMNMQKQKIKQFMNNSRGSMLILALVLTGLFMAMTMGAIGLALLQQKLNMIKIASNQAVHIAEAGVNYYRWVLYHDPEEYCNKEACRASTTPYGPYAYTDASGSITGHYELYITPPAINASTIVTVKSIGWEDGHPSVKRVIEVKLGKPSWSNFATLSNNDITFGADTEVWGPIHSNGGVRFDGIAHNIITSSKDYYTDPDHASSDVFAFGVHTHNGAGNGTYNTTEEGNPGLSLPAPDQSATFLSGREFPVPIVSFSLLDNYISETYIKASSSGMIIDPRSAGIADPESEPTLRNCISSTCDEGFHITLKTNNTFEIRDVSAVFPDWSNNPSADSKSLSIKTEGAAKTFSIPENGIIFVKNHVWIDGKINGSKVNVLAFFEPFTGTVNTASIITNKDLLYTNYDGTDSIGLIAQGDIGPGLYSEGALSGTEDQMELRIDAAMIAKTGRVGRLYYKHSSGDEYPKRQTITIYGSLATNQRYGFSYSCGTSDQWCSGYKIRNIIYDNNLTLDPPANFPTTGEYTFVSWKED